MNSILCGLELIYDSDLIIHLRKILNTFPDVDLADSILYSLVLTYKSDLLIHLYKTLNTFPEIDLTDAFSRGQIESKKWLINEISNMHINLGTVFILGGWYGTLSTMIMESKLKNKIEKIRSFDIDQKCEKVADTMNKKLVMENWFFKACTANMYELDYAGTNYTAIRANGTTCDLYDVPDTIINTSCEHLGDFDKWFNLLPKNITIILQSNDFFDGNDHINCVSSLEEFKEQAPLKEILYEGKLELEKYTRFMLIGKK